MLLVEVKNGKSPDSDSVFSTVTVPLHAVPLKFKAFPDKPRSGIQAGESYR
jgi:hypothetical protein